MSYSKSVSDSVCRYLEVLDVTYEYNNNNNKILN